MSTWAEVESWSEERREAFDWYGFQCGQAVGEDGERAAKRENRAGQVAQVLEGSGCAN